MPTPHTVETTRPRVLTLLVTQLCDGFGGRFHAVLLSLYALRIGGLAGFAGFTAFGVFGIVLSTVLAGGLTAKIGGRRTMVLSAAVLSFCRVIAYVVVALDGSLLVLGILRMLGAKAGTLMVNAAKAQVPVGENAATSLAWMNVANGFGQAMATAAAGALALGPPWAIALIGAPLAALPTLPMLRLARYATTVAVPLAAQWQAFRLVAPAALLGAWVQLWGSGFSNLKDGLTVELYSQRWLGPVTFIGLLGAFVAAATLPRLTRLRLGPSVDWVVWPAMGCACVAGWAVADLGIAWLLVGQLLAGVAAQALACLSEARVLEGAGRMNAMPALTASGGLAALASALGIVLVPPLLERLGYAGAAGLLVAPLALSAGYGLMKALRNQGAAESFARGGAWRARRAL
jgi:hypothetical protein